MVKTKNQFFCGKSKTFGEPSQATQVRAASPTPPSPARPSPHLQPQLHLVDIQLHLVDIQLHLVDIQLHLVDIQLHLVDLQLHLHLLHLVRIPGIGNTSSVSSTWTKFKTEDEAHPWQQTPKVQSSHKEDRRLPLSLAGKRQRGSSASFKISP